MRNLSDGQPFVGYADQFGDALVDENDVNAPLHDRCTIDASRDRRMMVLGVAR